MNNPHATSRLYKSQRRQRFERSDPGRFVPALILASVLVVWILEWTK